MKDVWTIIKKELKRYFTDPRMLITLILPGLIIFVFYSLMGNFLTSGLSASTDHDYLVYVTNEPSEMSTLFVGGTYEITPTSVADTEEAIAAAKAKVEDKTIDLYVHYEADFMTKVSNYDVSQGGKAPQIAIYYDSASANSSAIYQYYVSVLNGYETTIANKFDVNSGSGYDLASESAKSATILTMLMPEILIAFLFSGCMAVSAESIAGEKERGTITTLLVTPAKRRDIALGKIIALSITSLFSSIVSFLGLMGSINKLAGTSVSFAIYNVGTYLAIFAVIVSTVLLFTMLLSLISAYAKTSREASQLAVPLMMLVLLGGVSSFSGSGAAASSWLYLIPIYNSVQCFASLFSLSFNLGQLLITMGVNLLLVIGGLFVLEKMFDSEKIMFNR
jgi:sodium transport system permease protein